ncbi:acyltransferase [Vibrio penaeicida]|uniref:acyltransferase n=1 Tax=Vibrio penaeicida TaxID=104609 RepID=UPI002732DE37|nr:acyltransferase [Vibrio penaeicida]MDP2574635.1 acyltransferase [Vibrio penaeicida]
MLSLKLQTLKNWLKHSNTPTARFLFRVIKRVIHFELSFPKVVNSGIYFSYQLFSSTFSAITRVVFNTPAFKGRLSQCGKNLYLYGGIPFVSGPISISIGDNTRVSGHTTFSGRTLSENPTLLIGNNVDVGWQTTIAVGTTIILGNNVRIAGRAFLCGYPGHPIEASARAKGLPCLDEQCGDIILEDDVWLATGVSIMKGVTIGKRTIVAANSVVTHDLPSDVLAAGNPAKIIRHLTPECLQEVRDAS